MATPDTTLPATAPERRLLLSDLVNRVLDKGLVIAGSITIAVADVDLVQLDLSVVLTAVETAIQRHTLGDADLSLLSGPAGKPR